MSTNLPPERLGNGKACSGGDAQSLCSTRVQWGMHNPTFCQEHEQVPLAGCWWPAHSYGPGALLARECLANLQ
jgi:hypothetical protein